MQIINHNLGIVLRIPPKLLLIMKLTTFLLIVTLTQVSAAVLAQRVTLSAKDMPIEKVLHTIRDQSGYEIIYETKELKNEKLSITLHNASVDQAMRAVVKGLPYSFQIVDNNIVLSAKTSTLVDRPSMGIVAIDITGRVLESERGEPLVGATVSVKGTDNVVMTDDRGRFTLKSVDDKDIVEIRFVGFHVKQLTISEIRLNNDVRLHMNNAIIDKVVVVNTGYQTISKERATGSFKNIDKEQLDRPATTIAQRLIGTTSGLVAQVDANGNPTFRIRGTSTLRTGDDRLRHPGNPLIVLDGFPLEGATFNEINPNNVESITVLKDAAAASIWGSRSANGVIVITTKSGKKGVPFTADINTFTRIGSKLDIDYVRNLATSAETIQFEKYAFNRWGSVYNTGAIDEINRPASLGNAYLNEVRLGRMTQDQADAALEKLAVQDNRQQIRDHILDNPISNQINLNITASTSRVTNALSTLFETNSTAFKGTGNKRMMLNYRTEANIYKWLDLDASFMGQHKRADNNGFSVGDLKLWSPYDMILNPDGTRVQNFNMGYYQPSLDLFVPQFGHKFPYDFYYNPLRERESRNFTTESISYRIQAGLKAKILKGLSISSRVMYDSNNDFIRNLRSEDSFVVRSDFNNSITWDRTLDGLIIPNLPKGAQLSQSRSKYSGFNIRNQVDFSRLFAVDHAIDFVGGAEVRSYVTEAFNYPTTYGYNDETLAVGNFPNGPGGPSSPLENWLGGTSVFNYLNSFAYTTRRYYSVFANAMYTYKEKYGLSGSYRTDAANIIAATNSARYSPFWSVGGMWQLSKEEFIKDTNWIDRLALRLTYGVNGNEDPDTSPFPLINTGVANPETGAIAATISSYGNPLLRWEKTYMFNAGLDFSLLQGKIFGSVEWYNKKGRDLLADISIPIVNGLETQKLNNVKMYNKGIDIELGSMLSINQNIRWRGNINFSYNDNKITKLFRAGWTDDALIGGGTGAYVEGQNANTLWSYRYAGVHDGQPSLYGPNDVPFAVGTFIEGDARSWMENSGIKVAPYTLGLNNTFDIYRFSLSTIITGKFGHVFRSSGFNYPWTFNDRRSVDARFSEVFYGNPNDILPLPEQTAVSTTYSVWNNQTPYLNYLVANANHIRLQEISLAYNVDSEWLKNIGFRGLRVYGQGNDLLTIANNKYKEDPEYLRGSINPTPRFTFGFKLQL